MSMKAGKLLEILESTNKDKSNWISTKYPLLFLSGQMAHRDSSGITPYADPTFKMVSKWNSKMPKAEADLKAVWNKKVTEVLDDKDYKAIEDESGVTKEDLSCSKDTTVGDCMKETGTLTNGVLIGKPHIDSFEAVIGELFDGDLDSAYEYPRRKNE